jgi:hypothetical protein
MSIPAESECTVVDVPPPSAQDVARTKKTIMFDLDM